MDVEKWRYELYKGKVQSYVARGKESLTTVHKTLETALRKEQISRADLRSIFLEVERESVKPFVSWDSCSRRQNRLNELKRVLA